MTRFLFYASVLMGACLMQAVHASAVKAEPLRVLTEPYPGYAMQEGDRIIGAAADQVHAILATAKMDYKMQILPWARAYAMATNDRNTCIFATNHTPERDRLFKWVEPLGAGEVVLIKKAGSAVNPKTLEEARDFTVGVQRGDYAVDYLKRKGFTKLDEASDFTLTMKKLISGRVDLATTSSAAFEAEKSKGQALEAVLSMPAAIYALACSRDVPDRTIAALQRALNEMILDGTQDQLYLRYGMPAQNLQEEIKKTD